MRSSWLVLVVLAACDQGSSAGLKKMGELTGRMCACTTATCAQAVSDEMSEWWPRELPHMTEADKKLGTALGEEMGKCMQKAMGNPPAVYPYGPVRR